MEIGAARSERSIRSILTRHPIALDAARVAAEVTRSLGQVVVFEHGRAFVVASSGVDALQPRSLTDAEARLAAGEQGVVVGSDGAAVAVHDTAGRVVGAVSLIGEPNLGAPDALNAVGRLVSWVTGQDDQPSDRQFERAIVHGTRDAILLVDDDLSIAWANAAVTSILGFTASEVVGMTAAELVHPDDLLEALNAVTRMREGLEMYRVAIRLLRGDGEWEPVEITALDHTDDPVLGGLVVSLRNAETLSEEVERAHRTTLMSEAIVGGLPDGVLATDQFGGVLRANAAVRELFGIPLDKPEATLTDADFVLVDANGEARTPLTIARDFEEGEPADFMLGRPGMLSYIEVTGRTVRDEDEMLLGTVTVFRDITKVRQTAHDLQRQAFHDELTGLPNRRRLEEALREEAGLETRSDGVAISFVDLDGFKLVNDTYGHSTGDEIIRIAARRIRRNLDSRDLVVRQGGDEFVVLHGHAADRAGLIEALDRLRFELGRPYVIGDNRITLTASVGLAIETSADVDLDILLGRADMALYAAKTHGRNRVEIFGDTLAEVVESEERERRLVREALDSDRVRMHFQPLVDASTMAIIGYEALLRLEDDDGGIVGPAAFMRALSTTGLVWEIDRRAFDISCAAAAELARSFDDEPPLIACNFAAPSLSNPDFIETVIATVDRHGVDPRHICVEITETTAFDAGPTNLRSLIELRRHGFRVALDDFGTGYSSLAHLRDLPIDVVKVDRTFIAELTGRGPESAIVEAIVALADELDLDVVAEGVENREQLELVQGLGFRLIQGWLVSPAVPLRDALDLGLGFDGLGEGDDRR